MATRAYAVEKLWKIMEYVVLQHKTFQVMFYRQQRSWWYHFSKFEHIQRAENNDDIFGPFVVGLVNALYVYL